MADRQLRGHVLCVARRCLELGKHSPDYNIGIQHGLGIQSLEIPSPFVVDHTKQANVQFWAIRAPAPEIKIRVILTLLVVSLLEAGQLIVGKITRISDRGLGI